MRHGLGVLDERRAPSHAALVGAHAPHGLGVATADPAGQGRGLTRHVAVGRGEEHDRGLVRGSFDDRLAEHAQRLLVLAPDAHVDLARTDDGRGEHGSVEDEVRSAGGEEVVLAGRRLAFGGVDHDDTAAGAGDRGQLRGGREGGAATARQARPLDLRAEGSHARRRDRAEAPRVGGQVGGAVVEADETGGAARRARARAHRVRGGAGNGGGCGVDPPSPPLSFGAGSSARRRAGPTAQLALHRSVAGDGEGDADRVALPAGVGDRAPDAVAVERGDGPGEVPRRLSSVTVTWPSRSSIPPEASCWPRSSNDREPLAPPPSGAVACTVPPDCVIEPEKVALNAPVDVADPVAAPLVVAVPPVVLAAVVVVSATRSRMALGVPARCAQPGWSGPLTAQAMIEQR